LTGQSIEGGASMRAFTLESFEDQATVRDIPNPEPSADEVLVRVRASGVNGFDVALANRMTKGMMEHQFPVILMRELAGVVEKAGPSVTRFSPGDEVIGAVGAWPVVRTAPGLSTSSSARTAPSRPSRKPLTSSTPASSRGRG
jgi:NADPH:quinone reductase-like Zn-dependent oxidoreductase